MPDTFTQLMSQRVIIVGPNLRDQSKGEFHVHAAGCSDLQRDPVVKGEDQSWAVDATSRTEVCDAIYPPDDFGCESGDYLDALHFAPCVTLHP